MNIAVLLTCYNRRILTISCLRHILKARNTYNEEHSCKINLSFFITDDNCTDGTPDAIHDVLKNERHIIVHADGNAYWAGGMRLAWGQSLKEDCYDFFLLLNDDTLVKEICFNELLKTNDFAVTHYNCEGVYSGFVSNPDDESVITYGAKVYKKSILSGAEDLYPTGTPQECCMPNANILLVSRKVCNSIGILSKDFLHGAADWDYGLRALKAGFPVLTTSLICGYCKKDHDNAMQEAEKVISMSFIERKDFLNRPTKLYRDGLTFFRKYNKLKYIMLGLAYYINLFLPNVYYKLFKLRGH